MDDTIKRFINDKKFDKVSEKVRCSNVLTVPTKIPEEKLKAIGLIIARFQRLELTITDFIHYLIDSDINNKPITYILLARTSFNKLIEILASLSIKQSYNEQENLNFLLTKANRAEEIRNSIVHSVWSWGIRSKTKIKKKQLVFESENLTADTLERVADKIYKLDVAFNNLLMKLVDPDLPIIKTTDCSKNGDCP